MSRTIKYALALLLTVLVSSPVLGAVTYPTGPTPIDIRIAPSLCTFSIPTTTALNNYMNKVAGQGCGGATGPQRGDKAKLAAGVTFTTNLLLPKPGGAFGSGPHNYVVLTADTGTTCPSEGTRAVDANDSDGLAQTLFNPPIIKGVTTAAVIGVAENGVGGYRLECLKIVGSDSIANSAMAQIDTLNDGGVSRDVAANYPDHISFSRVIVDPGYDYGAPAGIVCHASHCEVIDSTITNIVRLGNSDVFTVHFGCGTGPYRLQNNNLSASGEIFFMGGGPQKGCATVTTGYDYQTPSDITIWWNKLFLPISWKVDDASYFPPTGVPTSGTFTSTSTAVTFSTPHGLTMPSAGTYLFMKDTTTNQYRKITALPTGSTATLASAFTVDVGGGGHAWRFNGFCPISNCTVNSDYTIANLLHKNGGEFKAGRRISIKYNYWHSVWIGSGQLYDLTFTPREYGDVQDVEVAYNYLADTMGMSLSVGDYEAGPGFGPSPHPLSRFWAHHNIWRNAKNTSGVSLGAGPFWGGTLGTLSQAFGLLTVVGGNITASGTTGSVTFTADNPAFTPEMVSGGLVLNYTPAGVSTGRATLATFTDSQHVIGTVTQTFGAGATSGAARGVVNWAVGPSALVGTADKVADSWVFEHNAKVGTDAQFDACEIFLGFHSGGLAQAKATNFVWRDNICQFVKTGSASGGIRGDKDGNAGTIPVDDFTDSATRDWQRNVHIGGDTLVGFGTASNYTGTLLKCAGPNDFTGTCKTAFHDPDQAGGNGTSGSAGFVNPATNDWRVTGTYATAAHDGTMIGPDLVAVHRYADYANAGIPYNTGAGASAISGSSGVHAITGSSGASATPGCIRGPIAAMDSGC